MICIFFFFDPIRLKGEMFLAGDSPLPSLKVLPNDTLWIQSMGHHLAGRYTCVAVSPEGAINATADIRVQDGDDGCKLGASGGECLFFLTKLGAMNNCREHTGRDMKPQL